MSQENSEYQNRPKPFSKERTKIVVNRIVFFYSLFYVIVKVVEAFQNQETILYLILAIPFAILALVGFKIERSKNYSWIYIIIGIILISVMRFYEPDILGFLYEQLN